jgi:hypothetical protein
VNSPPQGQGVGVDSGREAGGAEAPPAKDTNCRRCYAADPKNGMLSPVGEKVNTPPSAAISQ